MGGEWSFFYHIVGAEALFQEINVALAALVHNFPAGKAMLPHVVMTAFASTKKRSGPFGAIITRDTV